MIHFKQASVVLSILLIVVLKVIISAHMESYKAGRELSKGNLLEAVKHYSRSIEWYYPFSRIVSQSSDRIWSISEKLEEKGDLKEAYEAVSSIKAAISSIRWLIDPHIEWIAKCNLKLEGLRIKIDKEKGYLGNTDLFKMKNFEPDRLWSLVMIAGFLGWVFGAVLFIHYFFNRHKLKTRLSGVFAVISYLIWFLGLYSA